MKYLLDTDHFSIWQYEFGDEFNRLAGRLLKESPRDIGVSVVTFHEQALGANSYLARAKKPEDVAAGYARFSRMLLDLSRSIVIPFDEPAARMFQYLRSQRIRIGTMDLRIASVALAYGLTVLTRNTIDFERVPGLSFEDWTK